MPDPKKASTPFVGGLPFSKDDPPPFDAAPLPGESGEGTPPFEKTEREFEANPPPHPCVGCGYCCLTSQCFHSISLYGDVDGVCPSLVYNGERYRCAQVYSESLRYAVGIGAGCCSPLFNERRRRQIFCDLVAAKTPSPKKKLPPL